MTELERIYPRVFVAKFDGSDWTEQLLKPDGTWVDFTDGRFCDEAGDFEAVELEGDMAVVISYETPSGWRYAKIQGGGQKGALLPANLVKVGGAAGDNTTACTFTYTAKLLDGTEVITVAEQPAVPRLLMAPHVAATLGEVYQDADGWHLWKAHETLAQVNCAEE